MKRQDQPPSDEAAGYADGVDPLQDLFERAYDDGFTPREVEVLWSRVILFAGVPTAHLPSGAGSISVSGGGASLKIAAALAVGGLVAAGAIAQGWRFLGGTERAAVVSTAFIHPSAPATGSTGIDEPGRPNPLPSNVPNVGDRHEVAPASALTIPGEAPKIVPNARVATSAERRGAASVEPSPRLDLDGAKPPSSPTRSAATTVLPVEPPSHSSTPDSDAVRKGPEPAVLADQGPREGTLLLQARRALASDPAAALALTQEHARRFPAGDLVPEREVLAIEALAGLGRRSDARARLDTFERRFPQSLHIARLERLLAE
jgi:hypothetical protein